MSSQLFEEAASILGDIVHCPAVCQSGYTYLVFRSETLLRNLIGIIDEVSVDLRHNLGKKAGG